MSQDTGAEVIIKSLLREGVDTIFGYPGGTILSILDSLSYSTIRFILMRHEQAAVHAADGYARVTGRPGVCLVHAGPGATNLITGLATAAKDSVPVVAISGQIRRALMGKNSFQEIDIVRLTRQVVKYSVMLNDISWIPIVIQRAFSLAMEQRTGPVTVVVPTDISYGVSRKPVPVPNALAPSGKKLSFPGRRGVKGIDRAVHMLDQSRRPLICSGRGVIAGSAWKELSRLIDKVGVPVTTTLLGLGSFPSSHPLSLGMTGAYGTKAANTAMRESDLIIALGTGLNDNVIGKEGLNSRTRLVHVDIDRHVIGRSIRPDLGICADVRDFLRELDSRAHALSTEAWIRRLQELKRESGLNIESDALTATYVIEQIDRMTRGKAIICADVGQNQMWTARHYSHEKPRHFITSGGLGTAGYSLPASIGVKIARPEMTIFNITGDGGFQMNIQELATIATYNLSVKIAILNNRYLGLTRQYQQFHFNGRYAYTRLEGNPDFVALGKAYGIQGMTIATREQVISGLEQAIMERGPFILDFQIKEDDNILL